MNNSLLVFLNCFILCLNSLYSQKEITPVHIVSRDFEDSKKIEFPSVDVKCTNSPLKILLIDSEQMLISFYSKYGIKSNNCSEKSASSFDFSTYNLLYVGYGIGGNQISTTNFYVLNDTLHVLYLIKGSENTDYSLNTDLKFFMIAKTYANKITFNVFYEKP